jgi:hypothetical protein
MASAANAQQAPAPAQPASDEVDAVVVTGFRASLAERDQHQAQLERRRRRHQGRGHRPVPRPEPGGIAAAHPRRLDLAHQRRRPPDHRARPGLGIHPRPHQRHGGDLHHRRHRQQRRHQSRPRLRLQRLRLGPLQQHRRAQDRLGRCRGRLAGRHGRPDHGSRAFDSRKPQLVLSAGASYNDLAEKTTPRLSALASRTFFDGKLGVLISAAYEERHLKEEGANITRWAVGGSNGGFNAASTVPGYTSPRSTTPTPPPASSRRASRPMSATTSRTSERAWPARSSSSPTPTPRSRWTRCTPTSKESVRKPSCRPSACRAPRPASRRRSSATAPWWAATSSMPAWTMSICAPSRPMTS